MCGSSFESKKSGRKQSTKFSRVTKARATRFSLVNLKHCICDNSQVLLKILIIFVAFDQLPVLLHTRYDANRPTVHWCEVDRSNEVPKSVVECLLVGMPEILFKTFPNIW